MKLGHQGKSGAAGRQASENPGGTLLRSSVPECQDTWRVALVAAFKLWRSSWAGTRVPTG